MRTLCSALVLLALAGCGGADQEREADAPASRTDLVVSVTNEGRTDERTVTETDVTVADLGPVPSTVACTEIYGGDATAKVSGQLDGTTVDFEFNLSNGCEIARWEKNASLLGDPPRFRTP